MDVIKIGGAEGVAFRSVCEDLAVLWRNGYRFVIVHGGSGETNRLGEALGRPAEFVTSVSGQTSRRTDRETLEVFAMATALVNRGIVEQLQQLGVSALGLSGMDGRMIVARRKATIRVIKNGRPLLLRDEWTGVPERVDAALLRLLGEQGYLPVVAPLGVSECGEMLNLDGDRAAAAVAGALHAHSLVILTNVAGVMRRFPDETTLIRRVAADELETLLEMVAGRMRKKILGAGEALKNGVGRVIIGDGRKPCPVSTALAGEGTLIECAAGRPIAGVPDSAEALSRSGEEIDVVATN
ncbi:MAG: [LysW]-aminoadipate kinase [Planctomycetota bacterium]